MAQPRVSRRRGAFFSMLAAYASSAFGILTGLVLVPLYLRYFSMGTYGAWLASGGVVAMLGIFEGGLSLVVAQRLGQSVGSNDVAAFARSAGTGWAMLAALYTALIATGFYLAPLIPAMIHAAPADAAGLTAGLYLASIGTGCTLGQAGLLLYAQAWQETQIVSIATLCALVLGVAATLGGLLSGWGVMALGLGSAARGVVGFFIAVVYVVRAWRRRGLPRPRVAMQELREQMLLSAPLFFGRTGALILNNSEAAIVATLVSTEAAAVLGLTGKAYGVCQMLVNPIAGGAFLGLAHMVGSNQRGRIHAVVVELCALSGTAAAVTVGLALALNGSFVQVWVGPQAYGGLALSLAMAVNALFSLRMNLLSTILPALGVIGRPALANLVELGARLGLLFVLVPALGVPGIPLASFVAMGMLNMWLMPLFLVQWLKLRGRALWGLLFSGAQEMALGLGLGLLWAYMSARWLGPSGHWHTFVRHGAACGVLFALCLWPCSPPLRSAMRRVSARLATRLAPSR